MAGRAQPPGTSDGPDVLASRGYGNRLPPYFRIPCLMGDDLLSDRPPRLLVRDLMKVGVLTCPPSTPAQRSPVCCWKRTWKPSSCLTRRMATPWGWWGKTS